jgi:hypothetical protein
MLPRAGWWGDARLCVAQFLANLWQGPCMAVYGTSVGAIVRQPRPQATGTSGALLSSDDYGSSVARTARPHPLWRGLPCESGG